MGCYAHFPDVETEAQRSKVAYLESHSQTGEVQGSGPRTQAVYTEPGSTQTVDTAGKQRRGVNQRPHCVLLCPRGLQRQAWLTVSRQEAKALPRCPSVLTQALLSRPSTLNGDTASAACSPLAPRQPASADRQGWPTRGAHRHPRLVLRSYVSRL